MHQQQTPIKRQTSCQNVQGGCNFIGWQKGCQFGRILLCFSVENYHLLIALPHKSSNFADEKAVEYKLRATGYKLRVPFGIIAQPLVTRSL